MHLASRAPSPSDFDSFFDNCFSTDRDDAALRAAVAHEWHALLESPTTLSLLVEDLARESGQRVVGCAQLAFVSKKFVEWARRGERPWVNVQATHPLPDGSWPLLTPAEVRRAHEGGEGLSALITRWRRADALLNPDESRQVHSFMQAGFETLARGYRYEELLLEAVGDDAFRQALAAGFVERSDYAGFYKDQAPLPCVNVRPYLLGITREEACANEGCLIGHFFFHLAARLHLQPDDQELLCRALRGDPDEEIARSLCVSTSTVKKRWMAVYRHVGGKMPGLLSNREDVADHGGRGREKRRLLLHYLREHPEELRPAGLQ